MVAELGTGRQPGNGGRSGAQRVLLVGEERLLIESLRAALQTNNMTVSSISSAPATEVLKSVQSTKPDVVVIGERDDRPELIIKIAAHETPVVALCPINRVVEAQCVVAGAAAVLNVSQTYEEFVTVITNLGRGHPFISRAYRQEMQLIVREVARAERERRRKYERLTLREMAVLAELSEGRSASEIADSSYTSVNTVRTHIKSVLQKLEVNSQVAAVALAHRNGWVDPISA